MIQLELPKFNVVEDSGAKATFVIEPLERGFGTTLGNSLRRVLLSSLEGVATVSIKIDGVLHEFSTIENVKEDVTEIVLNVKGIIAKINSDATTVNARIDKVGPCEVVAGDIVSDGDAVEILNPEYHIATLDENAHFYMEMVFSSGRGYVSQDKNKQNHEPEIGVIYTDSIYTPVYNVNYSVENTRVGSSTDYDKLTLNVTTNGTISARSAVSQAAKILNLLLNVFTTDDDPAPGPIPLQVDAKSDVSEMLIEDLELTVRPFNCLKRANINTVKDLISMTEDDVIKIKNLGKLSLNEVCEKIHSLGLEFRKDTDR